MVAGRMEERSAGAILFRRTPKGRVYLLLRYPAGHWDFPKGNVEKGERPEETMAREVREETGLVDISRVEGFQRTIEYYYMRGGRKVHKEVIFFLAETHEEKVTLSFEHQQFAWLSYPGALKTVTYSNSKRILEAAEGLLRQRQAGD
jgi:bis(5'-nucleosidyl)-tetraphosphatase